jgi:hypothetical protein
LALSTGLLAAGCGDGSGGSGSPSAAPSSTQAPAVPYVVRLAKVTGKLPDAKRDQLRKAAGAAIDDWWRAAYLTTGAHNRFPGFTPGAAKLAQRDADLLTNKTDGDGVDSREVVRRAVDLDVLAVGGRAKGATARLHLTYDTAGVAKRCTVGGTVSLVPVGGRWRIFGYDVTHHCGPQSAAKKPSSKPSSKAPSKSPSKAPTGKAS